MEFREDIIKNGREILGRELTDNEIDQAEQAMTARLDMMYEDNDRDVDIEALFNEEFYDNLKEILANE